MYDQARNFLGDTYYKDSNELYEGDELNLDKGVMVEVAEAIGVTQTDLTALFEKKQKDPPQPRPPVTSQTRPFQRPSVVASSRAQRSDSQLRHKPLNTLLGTPKGPIGKAQPMKSPYETHVEREKENGMTEERAPKRQKTAPSVPSWRASSPVQEPSPSSKKSLPFIKPQNLSVGQNSTKFIPPSATVITIDSDPDIWPAITSDITLPSTPPKAKKVKAHVFAAPLPKEITPPQSLPVQTPKIPRGKVPVPHVKAQETPKQPIRASSPPVSASNRMSNVDMAVSYTEPEMKALGPQSSPPRNPKAKSLRLSVGVKRGTLLCQALPRQTSQTDREARTKTLKESRFASKESSPVLSGIVAAKSRKEISISQPSASTKGKRSRQEAKEHVSTKRVRVSRSPSQQDPDLYDDPELVHGMMDEQLLFPSALNSPPGASHPPAIAPMKKPLVDQRKATRRIEPVEIDVVTEGQDFASITSAPKVKKGNSAAQTRPSEQSVTVTEPTSLPAPVLVPPAPISRSVSPARSDISDAQSRANSTSPGKKALSTGGFRKKPKQVSKDSGPRAPTETTPAPPPRKETVALPPHPLRAGRKGPLMSTTELAALLQKPTKKHKLPTDPIEDEAPKSGKSPNRNFRRVRSENDAPIPSTSDDWEKRNLPKTSSTLTDTTEPGTESAIVVPSPQESAPVATKKKPSGLSALIKKTDPRRKMQRTQSLSVDTHTIAAAESEPVSPVVDKDIGPWSTDAFDLFDWRPPGREGGGGGGGVVAD